MGQNHGISRRRFLGSSVGSATVVLGSASALHAATSTKSAAQTPSNEIRCGFIGIGGRGSALLQIVCTTPGARVTALCDNEADHLNRANEMAKEDKPRLYGDYHEMLDDKDIDVVFVASPCYLHKEMFVAVLQSGRHCYGEKPLALSVRDINEIVRVQKASGKVFQIGTQLRYDGRVRANIKAIHDGVIGEPVLIRMSRHNFRDMDHTRNWLFKRDTSGDIIVEQAVHEFDVCNWIFKGVPQRACGFGGQSVLFDPPGRNVMDHYSLSFDYGKDKKVSYSHSYITGKKSPVEGIQIYVLGSKATMDVLRGTIHSRPDGKESTVPPLEKGRRDRIAVESFFKDCREGGKPRADVETARDATLVALLGRKALYEERVATMKQLLAEG